MGDARQIDFGGNTLVVDGIRVGATGPGQSGTELTGSEVALLDGITSGTVTASKAVVVDASKNIGTFGNLNLATGTFGSVTTGTSAVSGTLTVVGQPTFLSASAPPTSGSAAVGIKMGTSTLGLYFGVGVPTSSVATNSLYMRTDGSTTTSRLYVSTSATGGWATFTSTA
jgi:hypothetical protein